MTSPATAAAALLPITAQVLPGDADMVFASVGAGDHTVNVYETPHEPGRVVVDVDGDPALVAITVNDGYVHGGPVGDSAEPDPLAGYSVADRARVRILVEEYGPQYAASFGPADVARYLAESKVSRTLRGEHRTWGELSEALRRYLAVNGHLLSGPVFTDEERGQRAGAAWEAAESLSEAAANALGAGRYAEAVGLVNDGEQVAPDFEELAGQGWPQLRAFVVRQWMASARRQPLVPVVPLGVDAAEPANLSVVRFGDLVCQRLDTLATPGGVARWFLTGAAEPLAWAEVLRTAAAGGFASVWLLRDGAAPEPLVAPAT